MLLSYCFRRVKAADHLPAVLEFENRQHPLQASIRQPFGGALVPGGWNRKLLSAADGGGNAAGTPADVQRLAVVAHGEQAAIARYPSQRFRGNARGPLLCAHLPGTVHRAKDQVFPAAAPEGSPGAKHLQERQQCWQVSRPGLWEWTFSLPLSLLSRKPVYACPPCQLRFIDSFYTARDTVGRGRYA
jgi:hypothetical protein